MILNKLFRRSRLIQGLLAVLLTGLFIQPALAASLSDQFIISEFGYGDQMFLQSQEKLAKQLVYDTLLTRFNGEKTHDLALLQKLLDKRELEPQQRRELQALGSVFGNLLAKEFRLEWVIYIDEVGRSRGLQIDSTTRVIFPLTMISRRVEADAKADVAAIYEKVSGIIKYTRDNRLLFTE